MERTWTKRRRGLRGLPTGQPASRGWVACSRSWGPPPSSPTTTDRHRPQDRATQRRRQRPPRPRRASMFPRPLARRCLGRSVVRWFCNVDQSKDDKSSELTTIRLPSRSSSKCASMFLWLCQGKIPHSLLSRFAL